MFHFTAANTIRQPLEVLLIFVTKIYVVRITADIFHCSELKVQRGITGEDTK
jgi:hypothetical protein